MTKRDDLKFEAPGVGKWTLDNQHWPNPLSRFNQAIVLEALFPTLNRTFARYGELSSISGAVIHGFAYMHSDPVGIAPGSSNVQDLGQAVVAERVERARHAYGEKLWQKDLKRWDTAVKPDSIARNLALSTVDVDALDHDGLIDHVHQCRLNMFEMTSRHHMFSSVSSRPATVFALNVHEWTGLETDVIFQLLDGASPISAGNTPEFLAVVDAVKKDDAALGILSSDQSSESRLLELRELPGLVGDSVRRFWLTDGHRLASGFDLQNQCAFELPNTMIDRILHAATARFKDRSHGAREEAIRIRELVPTNHRAEFDDQLEDARNLARLKDERGLYNDVWATGITRKAILGAGRRLVADGLLSNGEQLVEADWGEIQSLLRGNQIVTDEELITRRKDRMSLTWRDAPATLGTDEGPAAPIAGLPPEMERIYYPGAILENTFSVPTPSTPTPDLTGTIASKGSHQGPARIAVGNYDFDQINPGDVLVTSTHSEAFNAIAGRVGAIVTDTGGILSHLSIVSRELGIPCVVSCKNATTVISEGSLVRVDGGTGKVAILD
jgi:rifampicin phosphotransferase